MRWSDLLLRLRALRSRRRAESDLDEELNFHLEMEARKNRLAGMPEGEARRGARVQFGGVEQTREECRDVRGLTFLEDLARDVRYGLRVLRKAPVFTTIAILSLAIGIGANTAIFSLVDAVLLRQLPVKRPEQLVIASWGSKTNLDVSFSYSNYRGDGHGGFAVNVFSWPIYSSIRARSRTFSDAFGFSQLPRLSVVANGEARISGGQVVTGNYFAGLGVGALMGRPLTSDDDTVSGATAVVISYRFWDRVFSLDPAAIGKAVYVNGQPCVIVGITPKGFFGVSTGGLMQTPEVDLTLPIRARALMEGPERVPTPWFTGDLHWIQVMGRVKQPGGEAAAKSELAAILAPSLPPNATPLIFLEPGSRGLGYTRRLYRTPLLVLMTVVGLTLLMACANLTGLLLARAATRQKEILLRLATGASRGRLVRQLLVEGALLSLGGAAAGLAFAYWGVRALLALMASGSEPIALETRADARVFAFTAAISGLTTLLFALAPAVRATQVDVAQGLKQDTASAAGKHGFGAVRALVAAQIAVALLLTAGATLFTRSLANLRSLPLGFRAENLVIFDIAPGKSGYGEVRGNQLYARLLERLDQTKGVVGASLSAQRLMSDWWSNGSLRILGAAPAKSVQAGFNYVGPDFFQVLQIPVVLGRGIERRDMSATPRVAVINQTLARSAFGNESPLGRRVRWSSRKEWEVEVVGVVKDARYRNLSDHMPATLYAPYTQRPFGWPSTMTFEVRTAGNTAQAIAGIRRAVAETDHMLPIGDLKTQERQIDETLTQERLFASLVSLFGAITLVLACVGLYGLVACSVTSRTREIGLRIALGASRTGVLRMILGQVAITAAAGLAVGLPATLALGRLVESKLYGIKARDPLSLAAAAAIVAAVAILAAVLPARRAMRIDPMRALRYE